MNDSAKGKAGRRRPQEDAASEKAGAENKAMRLRLRAAWMYYIEQMTQNEVADALGIGRVTVVRLLAEARARSEVRIAIEGDLVDIVALERSLERRFGLDKAIVAPVSGPGSDPTPAISAATGAFLYEAVKPQMTVGVGWGRTLLGSLPFIASKTVKDLTIVSLLGGISAARRFNPSEFAWQFSQIFQGDAYLIPAPAIVDAPETKRTLVEHCGLQEIFDMAAALDLAVLSVGGITSGTTSYRVGFLTEEERLSLKRQGAVGDVLFHFFDRDGRLVDHPLNLRSMSVAVESLRRAKLRVITSGGPEKVEALIGAMRLIEPNVLVTDEVTARALIDAAS